MKNRPTVRTPKSGNLDCFFPLTLDGITWRLNGGAWISGETADFWFQALVLPASKLNVRDQSRVMTLRILSHVDRAAGNGPTLFVAPNRLTPNLVRGIVCFYDEFTAAIDSRVKWLHENQLRQQARRRPRTIIRRSLRTLASWLRTINSRVSLSTVAEDKVAVPHRLSETSGPPTRPNPLRTADGYSTHLLFESVIHAVVNVVDHYHAAEKKHFDESDFATRETHIFKDLHLLDGWLRWLVGQW